MDMYALEQTKNLEHLSGATSIGEGGVLTCTPGKLLRIAVGCCMASAWSLVPLDEHPEKLWSGLSLCLSLTA